MGGAIQRFGNVFKPFAVVMKPLIDAISEKKSTLRACAEMATMKSTQGLYLRLSKDELLTHSTT